MTIRTTLLSAFLVLSLVSTLLMAGIAFYKARQTLRIEIRQSLQVQARTLMNRIDATLFERIKNVHSWSQLQIMQDMHIQDVDKRLAQFLAELHKGYGGIYARLFTTDLEHRIIADSSRELIGQVRQPQADWLETPLLASSIALESLQLQPPYQAAQLYIHTPLRDDTHTVMGEFYASFDWREIFELLIPPVANYNDYQPEFILIDAQRRIIAASPRIREQHLLSQAIAASWYPEADTGTFTRHEGLITPGDVLIGYAHSQGYRLFPGFGWRVLVILSASQAFAPVANLWWELLGFLLLITSLAVLMSLWIASKLALPIMQLTDYTRKARLQEPMPLWVNQASGEVGELAKAYSTLLQDLDQSREQLIRASKLAVIGEMAASMAHEVRTPLGILRSSAQMLQRERQLSLAGQEMTTFIIAETDRLNRLITTLLECARPHPPRFESQDIHVILAHGVELLAARAKQQSVMIHTHYQATRSQLPCDKDQITQVFLNLLINALQWSVAGGEVEIKTDSSAQQLRIKICDHGPGIHAEKPQQVFEPFFSQREDGIGLGLTVVQQIVLAHGGTIKAFNHAPSGACFQISLPLDRTNNPKN